MGYPPKKHQQNKKDVMRKGGPRSRICAGKAESAGGKFCLGVELSIANAHCYGNRDRSQKVNVRGVVVYRVDERTEKRLPLAVL
jgi:hypothetical protein